MSKDSDIDNLIEIYRSGNMDAEALRTFEERVSHDPVLRSALALYDDLDMALTDKDAVEFEIAVQEVVEKQHQKKTILTNDSVKSSRVVLWAILFILSALITFFFWNHKTVASPEKIYMAYYEPYPAHGISRSTDGSNRDWLIAYASEDYKKSIAILERLENLEDIEEFYLAQSFLAEGQAKRALSLLDKLIDQGPSSVFTQARWYKSLILIQDDQLTEAKRILEQIQTQPGKFGKKAKELLNKLSK